VAFATLAVVLPSAWCGRHEATVESYLADGYRFSTVERNAIEAIADATVVEVGRYLPTLPRDLVLKIQAGNKVVPETGETGYASPPSVIYWIVDPRRNGGVEAIARTHLRSSLFEFVHHLVRDQTVSSTTLMDHVVGDGMAIAFERDFAGASPPWGVYPDNVMDWVKELMDLPPGTEEDHFRSDPRRWMTLRAGTYLADRAIRASGQSAAQLVSMPTDDVIRVALGQ
jgi:hypothetical protein